ncbi:hypothetical protein WH52_00060 [Tenacibaculum holothuriorum]|uniref:Uncharacterized protein n=1 Tax=Tenacibaculum holothuriorum TaxID=1635173 RepID=A0A1Y2PF35_9FLAO|nr:hypothetical protein [Tenacibaculum holothuriorum]OSY89092.1 hypothetical protein WH52_00060 [Tenacibaculum holothuriorum]
MNLLKKISLVVFTLVSLTFYNCSGCDNENPTVKVTNSGTEEVSIQVKTSGGNTENLNNVAPGNSSAPRSFAPGEITYTIVLKDKTELVEKVTVGYCADYTVTIDKDNKITTSSVERD